MSKIIGIDLGTTNSCVCIIDGDKTKFSKWRKIKGIVYNFELNEKDN